VRVVIDVVSVMAAYDNDVHIGTKYVILAKHCMWFPDEGFM